MMCEELTNKRQFSSFFCAWLFRGSMSRGQISKCLHTLWQKNRTKHIKEQTSQHLVNNKQKKPTEDLGNTHPVMKGKMRQD